MKYIFIFLLFVAFQSSAQITVKESKDNVTITSIKIEGNKQIVISETIAKDSISSVIQNLVLEATQIQSNTFSISNEINRLEALKKDLNARIEDIQEIIKKLSNDGK